MTPSLVRAREQIDRAGVTAQCAVTPGSDPVSHTPTGARSWLLAWCGLRTNRPELTILHARRARQHAEVVVALRRQVELFLMEALASHQAGRPREQVERLVVRAERLFAAGRMTLIGDARDPVSGDLPYLMARVQRQLGRPVRLRAAPRAPGVVRTTRLPRVVTDASGLIGTRSASTAHLLQVAREEYASTRQARALPHAWRAIAAQREEEGALGGAVRALARALDMDTRDENDAGVQATLRQLEPLARKLGDAALAQAVRHHAGRAGSAPTPRVTIQALPTDAAALQRALHIPVERAALTARLRTLRANASAAVQPPRSLIRALAGLRGLHTLPGDSWAFTHEAGRLLYERGLLDDARRYLVHAARQVEAAHNSLGDVPTRLMLLRAHRQIYVWAIHGLIGAPTAIVSIASAREAQALLHAVKARGLLDLLDGTRDPAHARAHAPLRVRAREDRAAFCRRLATRLARIGAVPTTRPRRATVAARALASDEAHVEYMIGARASYVWVRRADRLYLRRLAGWKTLAPLVARFLRGVTRAQMTAAERAAFRALAERLHVELIGPVADLISRKKRLTISPDAGLHGVPFEALARPSRRAAPDWLIRHASIVYTPSMRVHAHLQQRAARRAARKGAGEALFLGAPRLTQTALPLLPIAARLPGGGMRQLSTLFSSLPAARAELRAAARVASQRGMRATRWIGAAASEDRWRRARLARFRLIHISTHGVSDAARWRTGRIQHARFRQPALILAHAADQPDDGVLRLEEILHARTTAELVILSGCTTGRGWRTLGDGAYGLAGAFLFTGSDAVLASSWPAPDRATSALIRDMYRSFSRGQHGAALDAPEALRRAQLHMAGRASGAERLPFYWAGFHMVGARAR